MRFNTTARLIADLEVLREHLGLDRWPLRGGSWPAPVAASVSSPPTTGCSGTHPDRDVRERATVAWARWEETVLSMEPGAKPSAFSGRISDDLLAMVRICAHFYANYGWLQDGELIRNGGAVPDTLAA
ncbi:hypothetical protein AB0M34_21010 [Nocardia sp. NPDC050193]